MDRQRILCLAGAVGTPFVTLGLRLVLTPWLPPHDAFVLFIIPVTFAARWCGGLRGGVVAVAVTLLLAHFYLPPDPHLLLLFVVACLPICGLAEVAERTRRKLAVEAERLAEADQNKGRMVALLAHELRNPLSSMSNALHLMRLTHGGDGKALLIAQQAAQQMGRLIDDLMDMNRLERGRVQLRYHSFDLRELLLTVTPAMAESAAARGLTLIVEAPEPVPVFADAVRLSQVMGNLIGNALKFTDQGSVKVHLFRQAKNACFVVEDTGMGIPPELVPTLWEPFRQGPTAAGRGGLGLGLSVVKGLVDVHGGSITLTSEPGKGTRFVVELPLEEGLHD